MITWECLSLNTNTPLSADRSSHPHKDKDVNISQLYWAGLAPENYRNIVCARKNTGHRSHLFPSRLALCITHRSATPQGQAETKPRCSSPCKQIPRPAEAGLVEHTYWSCECRGTFQLSVSYLHDQKYQKLGEIQVILLFSLPSRTTACRWW